LEAEFEKVIRNLTRPINGQYPRPWMTKLADPSRAKVFIVGKNQAKTYSAAVIGPPDRFINALFNRSGQSCRGLYDKITGGQSSPTRRNIDALTARLESRGIGEILETNVICYSTPMSSDLARSRHRGGKQRGTEIFQTLLKWIKPAILIADGSGTRKELGRVLGVTLPECPTGPKQIALKSITYKESRLLVFVIPSLAPPAYNRWQSWAPGYLNVVADEVAGRLSAG
jgi:hypothetical protein